jgi:hypothetical protein
LLSDQEEKWQPNEISWMLSRRLLGRVPSSPVRHFTPSTIRRELVGVGIDTVAFVMIYVTNAVGFMGSCADCFGLTHIIEDGPGGETPSSSSKQI